MHEFVSWAVKTTTISPIHVYGWGHQNKPKHTVVMILVFMTDYFDATISMIMCDLGDLILVVIHYISDNNFRNQCMPGHGHHGHRRGHSY